MSNFEKVKEATDAESFYRQFLSLKRKGAYLFALCPFHGERSPSFAVKARGHGARFKCHGCGEAGSPIDFLVKHLSLSPSEALQWLASFNGVALDSPQSDKNGPPRHERRKDGPKPAQRPKTPEKPILKPDAMDPAEREESSCPEGWERNSLFLFLGDEFGEDAAADVAELYHLGTGPRGETVFWYTDIAGNVRTGKATRYSRATGRRDKKFTKALHPQSSFVFRPCFFGEHLLPLFPGVPVDIVESEKTALVCTLDAWDGGDLERIFLATGGKDFLPEASSPRWDLLRGRELTFWPDVANVPEGGGWEDAGPLKKWGGVARDLRERFFSVETVESMQRHSTKTEREKGWDVADDILRARARERALVKRRGAKKRAHTIRQTAEKQKGNSEAADSLPRATAADVAEAERIYSRLSRGANLWPGGVLTGGGVRLSQREIWAYMGRRMDNLRAGDGGPAEARFSTFLCELEKAIFGGPE